MIVTKEEKQLLLIDLCARLPYGFTVHRYSDNRDIAFGKDELDEFSHFLEYSEGEDFKPYLRSMESMTAEEEYEYHQCKNIDYLEICEMEHTEMLKTTALCFSNATDWLNKNMFDYRGLIPMGLALETKEGMYK